MIRKSLDIPIPTDLAYDIFVNRMIEWWPREYTWSGPEALVDFKMVPEVGGLCSEIGPHGFRCDWGTVSAVDPGKMLALKWQINQRREPVPDPAKASNVVLQFSEIGDGRTRIEVEHTDFENHGEGWEQLYEGLNGKEGWEFLLGCYEVRARGEIGLG